MSPNAQNEPFMKLTIKKCPFCGEMPIKRKFCSSNEGPCFTCEHCGALGAPALGLDNEYTGYQESRLYPKAIRAWNRRR